MVAACEAAHDVGNDEADKTDAAGEGDAAADEQGDEEDLPLFGAFDVETEMARGIFAEHEGIQDACVADEQGQGDGAERGEDGELFPVERGEAAHAPEGEAAQLVVVGEIGEQAGEGAGESAEGDADEEHGGDVDVPATPCKAVERNRHGVAADKGGEGQGVVAECVDECREELCAEDDKECRAERGAAHDADDARVNQGIAEKPLHDSTGDGEAAADKCGSKRARQADVGEDMPVRLFAGPQIAGEAAPDQAAVNVGSTEAHGKEGEQEHGQQGAGKDGGVMGAAGRIHVVERMVFLDC